MKICTRLMLGMVALLLAGTLPLVAQEASSAAKAIVIRKVTRDDGNINVEKKEISENEVAQYLNELKGTRGENVELHLTTKDGENIRISPKEDGTLLYFREANSRADGLTKISEGNHEKIDASNWNWKQDIHENVETRVITNGTGRAILGIYPDESQDQKGVVIGSLSSSKGVAAAGLKAGDVITVVDGKNLANVDDLRRTLETHKPGDKVTVTYLRNGQPMQAEVSLAGEVNSVRVNTQRDPCRVFIGVGTSIRSGEGLNVDYIVENTPAQVSDVRSGDVILALDNVAVSTQSELEFERDKHQPGETFALNILRAGQPMTINAQFKQCSEEDRRKMAEESAKRLAERQEWMSFIRENRTQEERDPCAVFIGIYTHAAQGGGRQIDGIIKGTPAEASQLQKGDIIQALDDVQVNTYAEIIRERNKHQPGDRFTLSILRNGEYMEVDAQFKACGEQPTPEEIAPTEITQSVPETETPTVLPSVAPNRELKVEEWKAYPNPTFGRVNVTFRAEAVPTTLQIMDAAGKMVYEENLNRFDGYYQKQLNIGDNMPGVYILVVRQGEKVFYNKIVLLAKA